MAMQLAVFFFRLPAAGAILMNLMNLMNYRETTSVQRTAFQQCPYITYKKQYNNIYIHNTDTTTTHTKQHKNIIQQLINNTIA